MVGTAIVISILIIVCIVIFILYRAISACANGEGGILCKAFGFLV